MNTLPSLKFTTLDLKAEVLAVLLMERFDISTEQILLNPILWHQRLGRRDIVDWNDDGFSHRLEKKLFHLDTTQESIFDILPEYIFFPQEVVEVENHHVLTPNEQEENARKFLLPFQQLFFWLKIENEINSSIFEDSIPEDWFKEFSERELKGLTDTQHKILLGIIPYLDKIIGNWPLTQEILELLTGHEVNVVSAEPMTIRIPSDQLQRLGSGSLGINTIVGNTFYDGIESLKLTFNNLTAEQIKNLLPGTTNRKLLESIILPYLLPIEITYEILLVPGYKDKLVTLGEENILLEYNIVTN